MSAQPTDLKLTDPDHLLITWSDGQQRRYPVAELREKCPCATCREKRSQPAAAGPMLPVIGTAEAQPTALQGMRPVGNYAYSLDFSDGHNTGIYSFSLLRSLGEEIEHT